MFSATVAIVAMNGWTLRKMLSVVNAGASLSTRSCAGSSQMIELSWEYREWFVPNTQIGGLAYSGDRPPGYKP